MSMSYYEPSRSPCDCRARWVAIRWGEVGECKVNLIAVVVPVAVTAGVEVPRWRGAGKRSLFHTPFDRSSPGRPLPQAG